MVLLRVVIWLLSMFSVNQHGFKSTIKCPFDCTSLTKVHDTYTCEYCHHVFTLTDGVLTQKDTNAQYVRSIPPPPLPQIGKETFYQYYKRVDALILSDRYRMEWLSPQEIQLFKIGQGTIPGTFRYALIHF